MGQPLERAVTEPSETEKLKAKIEQLKQDLGHNRSDGYTVVAVRGAIDSMIAEAEKGGPFLPGAEPPELGVLRHLRQIAYKDHASDMFEKPEKK